LPLLINFFELFLGRLFSEIIGRFFSLFKKNNKKEPSEMKLIEIEDIDDEEIFEISKRLKHVIQKEVLSDPPKAAKELKSVTMTDSRWLAQDGWVKMSKNVNGTEVHYVYNTKTGAFDDFKFK
jgi:hypothetical protein